jgi:hypothetical protein
LIPAVGAYCEKPSRLKGNELVLDAATLESVATGKVRDEAHIDDDLAMTTSSTEQGQTMPQFQMGSADSVELQLKPHHGNG